MEAKKSRKSKNTRAGKKNVMLLLGLVLFMGASTSASEALSSSSFTSSSNGKAFTKQTGLGHFQSNKSQNNGHKAPEAQNAEKTGKLNGKRVPVTNNPNLSNNNSNNNNGYQHNNGKKPYDPKQHQQQDPDPVLQADFIADTKLPTDVGQFQLRAYRVRHEETDTEFDPDLPYQNTNALEPVVIYSSDKPPFGKDGKLAENVPVRIHDQCLTSEVFRSQR